VCYGIKDEANVDDEDHQEPEGVWHLPRTSLNVALPCSNVPMVDDESEDSYISQDYWGSGASAFPSGESDDADDDDEDGPVSTEVWEDISWLLQEVTLFKKSDFDGRVRQYLHAIRTASGRSGVQEALLKVRNSVNGMHRDDVKKPSAYLQTLLRRHLKSSC